MIFLIDFENVSNDGLLGIDGLSANDKLVLFFSKNANSISLKTHIKLEKSPAQKEYIEINCSGKNALDFQLATYLGFLIATNSAEQYAIVSKDTGFASVVAYWKGKKIDVENYINLNRQNDDTVYQDLRGVLPGNAEDYDAIVSIISNYKTKQGINTALVKKFKADKAAVIYKAIKPIIKNKKGN